jgi:hypothetical protein
MLLLIFLLMLLGGSSFQEPADAAPRLRIVYPADNAVVPRSTEVPVLVDTENFSVPADGDLCWEVSGDNTVRL